MTFWFLVTNNRGHSSLKPVKVIQLNTDLITRNYRDILNEINTHRSSVSQIRTFDFEHVPYVFNYRIEQFVRMQNLDEISSINQLIVGCGSVSGSGQNGFSDDQRDAL